MKRTRKLLIRECREEIGVTVEGTLFTDVLHDYPDLFVTPVCL